MTATFRTVRFVATTVITLALLALPGLAHADQLPPGCTSNNLAVDISRSLLVAHPGDTVDFTVTVSNGGAGACDVLNTDVDFVAPDGTITNLVTGASFPADGSGYATYGPMS